MTLKDTIANIINKYRNRQPEVYGDMETRDNYLRSLRRERRIQLEQEEKKMLIAKIKNYKMQQQRENLYGMKKNILRTPNHLLKKEKKAKWL